MLEAIASSPGLGVAVEIRLIGGAEVVLVGDRRRGLFSVEIGERESVERVLVASGNELYTTSGDGPGRGYSGLREHLWPGVAGASQPCRDGHDSSDITHVDMRMSD